MDSQIIPHAPKWYLLNGFDATPDNGFLYVSTFSIVYVSGTTSREDKPRFKLFHVKNFIKCLSCDPDWSESRYFAAFTHQNTILVFDATKSDPVLGHKGHLDGGASSDDKAQPNSSRLTTDEIQQGVLCFTSNKRVYSIYNDIFINYCVRSNTWVVEKVNFRLNKNQPTIMKASPYDPNIVALGTRAGLIIIGDLKKKSMLYTLRGHDKEITSLDWMTVRLPRAKEKTKFFPKEPKNLKPLHDDTTDLFDIYSYDDLENEFGVETDSQDAVNITLEENYSSKEVVTGNENFNFVEACQTLKEEMLAKPEYAGDESFNRPTADEIKDTYNLDCDRSNRTMDDSNRSVSSREDITSDEMGEFKPEPEAISDENAKDFIMVDTFVARQVEEENFNVYLVSGARENVIWFWDIENGAGVDKIIMNSPRHSNMSKPIIIVSWMNETTLLSTNPNGDMCEWKLNFVNGSKIKVKMTEKQFIEKSVFAFSTNKISPDSQICPLLWSLSFSRIGYCTRLKDNENIFLFGTTGTPINFIAECPMDLNKIGIACCDKRICIINVSNLKPNFIPIVSLMNKIQSKVLSLAWHPTKEHILAYSTSEGQVGIYDTTKANNVPIRIKAFTGLAVYTLSWGEISSDNKKSTCVLFASDKVGKFVYIPESGDRKHQPIPIKDFTKVSEVSCYNNLMAAGTTNGRIFILNLKNNFEEVYSEENLTRKYISSISWNPINKNLLAISSDDGTITIMDITKPLEKRKLVGHILGVTSVKWSNNSLNKLVSSSFDLTVRVWDINTITALSINIFQDFMFSAIFSPLDDNFIICAGNRDPLTIYDSRESSSYNPSDIGEIKARQKTGSLDIAVKWATQLETVNPNKRKEQRQNLKLDELSTKLETITVDDEPTVSKPAAVTMPGQVINATLCYLTNLELNRDALKSIQYLLDEKHQIGDGDHDRFVYHQKLFGSRQEINELLQNELKNLKSSMSNTIGNLLLPQIMGQLKSEILEKIEKKQLTEQHVAVSPHISHEFWSLTCKAYGYQCIEKGMILNAVQYLMATHEINDVIESLCKGNYYREAWIIAKLYKELDDPCLREIFDKWSNYLSNCGNFVGLALLNICNKNYKSALESLHRVKNQTEDIQNVMDVLKMKL